MTTYPVALEATGLYLIVELFSFNVPKCISEPLDVCNEPRSNKASNGKPRGALCALQREQKLKKKKKKLPSIKTQSLGKVINIKNQRSFNHL